MLKIFVVHDSKTSTYGQPQFFQTTGAGVRGFTDLCNDPNTILCTHAADFTLMEIGEYNPHDGAITIYETKKNLGNGLDLKKENENVSTENSDS